MKNFACTLSLTLTATLIAMAEIAKSIFLEILEKVYGDVPDGEGEMNAIREDINKAPQMFLFFTEFTLFGIAKDIQCGKLTAEELQDHEKEIFVTRLYSVITVFLTDALYREMIGGAMTARCNSIEEVPWFGLEGIETALDLFETHGFLTE